MPPLSLFFKNNFVNKNNPPSGRQHRSLSVRVRITAAPRCLSRSRGRVVVRERRWGASPGSDWGYELATPPPPQYNTELVGATARRLMSTSPVEATRSLAVTGVVCRARNPRPRRLTATATADPLSRTPIPRGGRRRLRMLALDLPALSPRDTLCPPSRKRASFNKRFGLFLYLGLGVYNGRHPLFPPIRWPLQGAVAKASG